MIQKRCALENFLALPPFNSKLEFQAGTENNGWHQQPAKVKKHSVSRWLGGIRETDLSRPRHEKCSLTEKSRKFPCVSIEESGHCNCHSAWTRHAMVKLRMARWPFFWSFFPSPFSTRLDGRFFVANSLYCHEDGNWGKKVGDTEEASRYLG